MTLVRGFSGFGKCFEHQRWKFKKSKEQEINDGNDYNDAHRAPPSMMVHHGEDVLAQNSDCAPQPLSDKQPLCKAVSWTVEFLVEFDKYYQRQIQISTDGETSRLASLRQATSLQGSDSGKCTNVKFGMKEHKVHTYSLSQASNLSARQWVSWARPSCTLSNHQSPNVDLLLYFVFVNVTLTCIPVQHIFKYGSIQMCIYTSSNSTCIQAFKYEITQRGSDLLLPPLQKYTSRA